MTNYLCNIINVQYEIRFILILDYHFTMVDSAWLQCFSSYVLQLTLLFNKTDVERWQTLGHPRSINPNMIKYVANHLSSHICCLYTEQ